MFSAQLYPITASIKRKEQDNKPTEREVAWYNLLTFGFLGFAHSAMGCKQAPFDLPRATPTMAPAR